MADLQVQHKVSNLFKWGLVVISALLAVRLISLGLYPFFDTTESRYGEIARLMLQTDNWITPQIDYNIPFWGKPPMHTWLSALGLGYLGVNEFAARLPHFLVGILTLGLIAKFARAVGNRQQAIFSVLIMCSSLGFILASGMVMTDSLLLFSYTLALISFWFNWKNEKPKLFGHLFFVALALGMLIKGPVMVVFVVLALSVWSIWQRCFISALKSLPWISGMALLFALILPWYVAAELRTPGFLEYFILGEHIHRFLVSGWQGDLYGSAHVRPRGSIWLFAILCAFPWSLFIIKWAWKALKSKLAPSVHGPISNQDKVNNAHLASINPYLVSWMIAPLILFTFAGNILPIYALPGFSAMALILALNIKFKAKHLFAACVTLIILVLVISGLSFGWIKAKTEAPLLLPIKEKLRQSELYYWQERPFSGQFYSLGQAQAIENKNELIKLLNSRKNLYIGLLLSDYQALKSLFSQYCVEQDRYKRRLLLLCTRIKNDESSISRR